MTPRKRASGSSPARPARSCRMRLARCSSFAARPPEAEARSRPPPLVARPTASRRVSISNVLRFDRGEHAEALRDLDSFIDVYNARALAHVRRADGGRHRVPLPRRRRPAALQGRAQGVRRSVRAPTRTNQEAQRRARRAVPREVQRQRTRKRGVAALAGEESASPARLLASARVRVLRWQWRGRRIGEAQPRGEPEPGARARVFVAPSLLDARGLRRRRRRRPSRRSPTDSTLARGA